MFRPAIGPPVASLRTQTTMPGGADLRAQLQAALGGAYAIERELGGGGMSRVFLATETGLTRSVVVKILTPELAAEVSAERFAREVKLAARLQQANIVPLLNAGNANGLPWYSMPFVRGESLRAKLSSGAPVPVTDAVHILRDVARALAFAHGEGVAHRDIKPENILHFGRRGRRHRLRHREGADDGAHPRRRRRLADDHANGRVDRHARLHGARASRRRSERRPSRRHLRMGRRGVGAARRQASVRGEDDRAGYARRAFERNAGRAHVDPRRGSSGACGVGLALSRERSGKAAAVGERAAHGARPDRIDKRFRAGHRGAQATLGTHSHRDRDRSRDRRHRSQLVRC